MDKETETPTMEERPLVKPVAKKWVSPKLIFLVLGLVVLGELFWAGKTLLSPTLKPQIKKIQPLSQAQLVLSSARLNYMVGEVVPIRIKVVTGGRVVDGVDVILHFDPKILEATPGSFFKGKTYKDYPLIDIKQSDGVIKISALTLPGFPGFMGVGTFGLINFKAKAAGSAKLAIDFQKDSTVDSNLIEASTSKDILAQVIAPDILVGDSKVVEKITEQKICNGYTQYCFTNKGKTGTQFCRKGVTEGDACVFAPQITVSCTPCSGTTSK